MEQSDIKFELIEVTEENKDIIYNLMQIYTYELSFYEDEHTHYYLSDKGLYPAKRYIDMYWQKENRHPYILKCNGILAGFVLQSYNERNMQEIVEFFVINKFRKLGAGTFMANMMFDKYKGKWEVKTLLKNERAQKFWRATINKYSKGNFQEKLTQEDNRYTFYFEN